jgi:hypothetical protein
VRRASSILICDLPDVVSLLRVLKLRLASHEALFEPVLLQVLRVCSQVRGGVNQ